MTGSCTNMAIRTRDPDIAISLSVLRRSPRASHHWYAQGDVQTFISRLFCSITRDFVADAAHPTTIMYSEILSPYEDVPPIPRQE